MVFVNLKRLDIYPLDFTLILRAKTSCFTQYLPCSWVIWFEPCWPLSPGSSVSQSQHLSAEPGSWSSLSLAFSLPLFEEKKIFCMISLFLQISDFCCNAESNFQLIHVGKNALNCWIVFTLSFRILITNSTHM